MSELHEQYVIQKKLGEGGMGTVYLAEDKLLERPVAIKALHANLARGADSLGSRFQQEALALARLNHPNITHLYSFIPHQDTYWMVMEFVDGKTLEDWLKIKGTLSPVIACSILTQMLDGLEHAHRKGIIHRDLKPANVMISADGDVKIMDFGIARIRNSQRMTQHGKSVGTLEYMSPEQIQGKEGDELTDIYSAGNILYELLSGQTPFKSDTDYHLMKAKLEQKPPLTTNLATVQPALQQAIFKSLEINPQKRFPDVRAFKMALERSIYGALLKPADLVPALMADTSPAMGANKTAAQMVSRPKKSLAALTGKINFNNITAYFNQWNLDKSWKLLIAVIIICAGLLIWNFTGKRDAPNDTAATQPVETSDFKVTDTSLATGNLPPRNSDSKQADQAAAIPASIEQTTLDKPANEEKKTIAKKGTKTKKPDDRPVEPVEKKADTPAIEKSTVTTRSEPSGPVRIPEGRRITVVLDENLSSEQPGRDGGPVRLHCAEDVVVNGKTIIRKGAAVTGKIVDVIPSGGRKKSLIGFVIHKLQATDGSSIRLKSDRFRLQGQSSSPAVYNQGASFTVELGRGTVN